MRNKWYQLILVAVVLLVAGSATMAMPPLGPPTAGLKQGQWGIGAEYGYNKADLDVDGETLEDFKTNLFLAQPAYGISDAWEVYALLGTSSAEVEDWNGDWEFAYGFGTKYTFVNDPKLSWGVLFEMLWGSGSDKADIEVDEVTFPNTDLDLDYWDMTIAVGPTWHVSETFRVYGGPFFYMFDGEFDPDVAGLDTLDLEEESSFGGYVGAEWDMCPNTALYGDFQFTGDALGFGVGVNFKF